VSKGVQTVPALPHRQIDAGLVERVNRFAADTAWLHGPTKAYASYGVVLFALLLLAGWWISRPRSSAALAASVWAGAGGLLAVAVNQPLVSHFAEARPYAANPALLVLADRSSDPSFPSDHAMLVGAVAAALWFVDRRLAAVATVGALLMAVARVYTAAHYPHDVAWGLLLGATIGVLGWLVVRSPLTALVEHLRGTRLRPLVGTSAAR
jgi:undecaprenyl-diphosphatase